MRNNKLNYGIRAVLVMLLFTLGAGNAWGLNSDYYTKVTLSKTGNGSGKVYAQKGSTTGTWTENGATSANDSQSSAPTHTWYLKATQDDGSAFTGWDSFSGWKSNPVQDGEFYKGTITGNASADKANGKATATFVPVEVNDISATSHTFNPVTNAKTDCNSYKETITFTTKYADAMVDFVNANAVLTKTAGDGVFALEGVPSYADNTVTATVKFTGNNRYASTPGGSRTSTATLTLTSKGSASQTKTCTFTATFPSASVKSGKFIVSGEEGELYTTNTSSVSGDVEFSVLYADALGDFTLPAAVTEKSHSGDTWSIGTITGPNTNYETGAGKIVIPITFTSEEGKYGDHTAKITLGGVTVTMTAHVEELADYDVKVVDADGTAELYKGAWADGAFTALNGHAGSTMIVGRDFNIGSVSSACTISQNVTLDLNGKAVTATLTAVGSLLKVTSGKMLKITDSKAGGSMQVSGNLNGRISVVEVTNGSLDLQKGDLVAVNSNTGTTKANIYVAGVYLASRAWANNRPTVMMSMSGGSVTGRRDGASGDYCYGVYCAGTGTSASAVDLTGGAITADFPKGRYAEGIYVAGKSTISDMTITASSKSLSYAIRCEDGQLVVNGGTYKGLSTEGSARGILAVNANVLGGTFIASAGTDHATAAYTYGGTFAVNAGTFTATSGTGKAYAVYVARNNNNIIKVNGGTFSAEGVTEAYGIGFDASNNIVGEISTTAGSFTATASSTAATVKSYGLYLPTGATANIAGTTFKGVTSGNAAVTGSSNNSSPNGAYGIWSSGTLTLTNSTIQGQSAKVYAYGLYTTQPVTMTGTSLSAVTTGANGADHATALFINGSGKTVTANNCSFSAEANTTYAYGVYASAGILESNNSTYSAVTKQTGASAAASSLLRGIYNNSGTTVTLNGGEIACSGNALYSQNAYGIYTAGTATITDVTITCTGVKSGYALYPENTNATMTVNSGMFKGTTAALYINTDKKPKKVELYGGFYSHDTNLKTYKATGCEVYDTPDGSAEKEQGYNFKVADGSNPGVVVAKVYNSSSTLLQSYNTLVEALQFVNANAGTQYTIVMVGDYILPAGDYTVPPQTALVIPDVNTRTAPQGTKPNRVSITTPAPTPFRKLTLVDGAHIAVYGTIETTANQNTSAGGSALSGAPTGPYGYIQMNAGSTISMESGSNLNSWGYIIGKGEITAQKGSTIREQFQMGYWRGGTATSNMVSNRNSWHAFPVMDYFYQNIEAPITYRPGATAYGYSKVHQSYDWVANDIKLLGTSEAMFLMDNDASEDNTWVRKEYNPATDRVEWTMNSGAKLGNFRFTMANQNINSADYYLPITNNMTITIKDGDCTITQDVILVPGAQLIINKTAKLKVSSGKKLFVVDTEDWKKCGSYYYYKANYSPSWTNPNSNPRTATQMPDAEIFVHGETEGSYYTSTHGANIHSTNEDAGKVKFIAAAGAATSIQQIINTNCDKSQVDFTTAQLKNEKEVNSSYYTSTEGTRAGYAYIYEDQQWINVLDGCLTTRTDGSGTHYYARPGDNVAVLENNDDAAYHGELDKDADRYFIFTEKSMSASDAANCVWWEADKIGDVDGDGVIYYMANKEKYDNYGAYYYYDSEVGYWKPRFVSITWKYEVDGTAKTATYNSVYYHTSPLFTEFANPHKKDDASYSYAWTGWTDEDGLFYTKDSKLPLATKNTTYTAKFEATRLQGSVTFKNYNGGALESILFDSGTIPTCSLTPTRSADVAFVYTFDGWSTTAGGTKDYEINGLPEVVKKTSVTYYAHYSATARPYIITFANYNGDPVQNKEFGYNTHPTYDGADPTRANSGFWSYNFIGWTDKDDVFYAKGTELPIVKGVATYTAKYEAVDWTPEYTITFKDGDNKVLTTQTARLNVVPEYAGVTPTKTATAQYIYSFNNTWSPAIQKATANATYTAQFDSELRSYTITFCNEAGRELASGIFDYGEAPNYSGETPKKDRVGSTVYTFDGWSSSIGGAKLTELPTVSKAATYYAHFSDEPVYVVRFNAQGHGSAPANIEVINGSKIKEPDALYEAGYTFGGWYKEAACTNAWDFASDIVDGTTTLYAKWTKSKYTITWLNDDDSQIDQTEVEYGVVPTHADATKPNTDVYTYTFIGWDSEPVAATGPATYKAQFSEAYREYTITWLNKDGSILETTTNYWDEEPAYPMFSPTPTYIDNEYHYIYEFEGWEPEIHAVNSDVNVYTAKYRRINDLDVPGEQTVSVETTVSTTKVRVSGRLVVASHLTTDDLILEGSLDSSGQIENSGTVTATNVYYDLSNGENGFKARTWYAIAVPWQVDVPEYNQTGCGVYLTNDGENFTQQNLGATFDLLYYDGATRAAQGHSSKCWKLVENDDAEDQIIYPGRAYMIYLTSDAKTIRFKKKADAALFITKTHVQPYSGNGNAKDANWNGIANPATFHAYLNTASGNQGQVYIAGADRYDPIADMSTYPLVVGQPVFVQATSDKTVVACATKEEYASHAPRRMSSSEEEKIMAEVRIAPEGKTYTDRLYVGVEEFKADEYEIGKDLAKAGISTKVAQIWVNRYNTELCINSMALVNSRADYPLTISTPVAGEYTIGLEPSAMEENQQYVFYLTFNGQPIWNLNYNAYTATLEKGTTEGYGLRLVYNAPEIATGIEETTILNGEQVRKVMIDEKVYIIRGGQVYGVDGQLVK